MSDKSTSTPQESVAFVLLFFVCLFYHLAKWPEGLRVSLHRILITVPVRRQSGPGLANVGYLESNSTVRAAPSLFLLELPSSYLTVSGGDPLASYVYGIDVIDRVWGYTEALWSIRRMVC